MHGSGLEPLGLVFSFFVSFFFFVVVPAPACTTTEVHDCPGTTTTEGAVVTVTPATDGGDAGQFQSEAGPGPDCIAACGDQVIACSSMHRCPWKTWDCVTCSYQSRCP